MSIDWQMKRRKLDELVTLEGLTGWLGRQNPGEEYVWSDPVFCLMGRYLMDHDASWGEFSYSELPGYREIAQEKPWTFGAALERARALSEEQYQALPAPPLQIEAQAIEVPQGDKDAQPAGSDRELVAVQAGA